MVGTMPCSTSAGKVQEAELLGTTGAALHGLFGGGDRGGRRSHSRRRGPNLRLQGGDNFVGWVTGNALVRTLAGVGELGRGHTDPSAATGVAWGMAI